MVQKNAYRHTFWTFQLTKHFGPEFALALSNAHESAHPDLTIEGPFDHVVDKINNLVGVKLAAEHEDAGSAIEEAWNDGHLAWADNFREEGDRQVGDIHFQGPLDHLWDKHRELPSFDARELHTLDQDGVQLPG